MARIKAPHFLLLAVCVLPCIFADAFDPASLLASDPQEQNLNSKVANALNALGAFYYQSGAYDKAIASLEDALKYQPENPDARVNLAMVYMQQGKFQSVIETLDSTHELSQPDQRSVTALAVAYFATGKYDKAAPYYRKLSELQPQDNVLRLTIAAIHQLQGDSASAQSILNALPKDRATQAQYHAILADAHRSQLRLPQAISEYEKGLAVDSTIPNLNYIIGVLYSDLNRMDKASEAFQQELKVNPQNPSANYSLGAYYLNYRNDAEQARQYFDRALKISPDLLEACLGLMKIELSQGRPQEAINLAQRVEQAGQNNAEYHYLRSRAFNLLGKRELAEKELKAFEELRTKKK